MAYNISFYCDDYERLSVEILGLGLSHKPSTHTLDVAMKRQLRFVEVISGRSAECNRPDQSQSHSGSVCTLMYGSAKKILWGFLAPLLGLLTGGAIFAL